MKKTKVLKNGKKEVLIYNPGLIGDMKAFLSTPVPKGKLS